MTTLERSADLVGRILIAVIFVKSGVEKIGTYAGTQAYMDAAGVPGALLPAVIALEVLGGLALVVGYRTRIVAVALAAFTALAGFLFHGSPDQMQQLMFLKNLAIAGGLLILAARGAGSWSLDARSSRLAAPGDVLRSS
jgi:putative oxidoreductase